jgi:HEAT repeats
MTETEPEVARWITQLYSASYETRQEASEQLVALGARAVPALIEVACAPKLVARMRAMEALGTIGDRRAFWPLAELTLPDDDYELVMACRKTLIQLAEHLAIAPIRSDAAWFIAIVRKYRFDSYGQSIAVAAARGALTLAQTDPGPELLPILALLKGNFIYAAPAAFGPIRKALLPLLAPWKDLPVAADAPLLGTKDLPRPAEEPRE